MSSVDWSPLAAADPIPGDPAAVRRLAARHQQAAEQVGDQVDALRRITRGTDDWHGTAALEFQARVGRVPDDLVAVGERFRRVAQALREFAPVLESAQRRARAALVAAQAAQASDAATTAELARAADAATTAELARMTSQSTSRPVVGPPVWPRVVPFAAHVVGPFAGPLAIGLEDPHLTRARRQLALACEERDRAAARCARAISAAGHDRLRNPSGWHRFLGAVSSWAGVCSTWLGVAALVLCVVPGLGPILGAASLALALAQLTADTALAAEGDAGWGSVGIDLLGTLPMGRAARLGGVLTRGRAVEQAGRFTAGTTWPVRGAGRGLRRLGATSVRFERSRGLHGLAQVAATRPGHELRAGLGHLTLAVRSAGRPRTLHEFVRSPGGLLDEVTRARDQGPGAVLWLSGGHAADLVQSTVGVPYTPQQRPAW